MIKEIRILDIFEIVGNDDAERWEFTPRVEGYTSYTVSYEFASTKADAILIVYNSIKAMIERSPELLTNNKPH